MFVAKELTPTSWLVYDNHNLKHGILSKHDGGKYTYIGDGVQNYANKAALLAVFGDDMRFEERIIVETEQLQIEGFSVDVTEMFDVIPDKEQPSYTKRDGSKIRHYAGFWGIKFSHGYALAFCPKTSTTEKYETLGPFKDKLFAQQEIRQQNAR